jgi:hypothetical protein
MPKKNANNDFNILNLPHFPDRNVLGGESPAGIERKDRLIRFPKEVSFEYMVNGGAGIAELPLIEQCLRAHQY